ncbi:hypothetical protein KKF84_06155 [Myxococcota bacterium]|nr:hypothetical protein [Myxococcota bacterium]
MSEEKPPREPRIINLDDLLPPDADDAVDDSPRAPVSNPDDDDGREGRMRLAALFKRINGHHREVLPMDLFLRGPRTGEDPLATLPRRFPRAQKYDLSTARRAARDLLVIMEALAADALPCPSYPEEDLQNYLYSLARKRIQGPPYDDEGAWTLFPRGITLDRAGRDDFMALPTRLAVGILTLTRTRRPDLIRDRALHDRALTEGLLWLARETEPPRRRRVRHPEEKRLDEELLTLRSGGVIELLLKEPAVCLPMAERLNRLRCAVERDLLESRERRSIMSFTDHIISAETLRLVDMAALSRRELAQVETLEGCTCLYRALRPHLASEETAPWREKLHSLADGAPYTELAGAMLLLTELGEIGDRGFWLERLLARARSRKELENLEHLCRPSEHQWVVIVLERLASWAREPREWTSLDRRLVHAGGQRELALEWYDNALAVAPDKPTRRHIAHEMMQHLRDRVRGRKILRELGDLK